MKDNHFTDRLLEESLKQSSRVSAPEDFAERLAARAAREKTGRTGLNLRWLLAPAAVALALSLALIVLHPPSPRPAPGIVSVARQRETAEVPLPRPRNRQASPAGEHSLRSTVGRALPLGRSEELRTAGSKFRTLTEQELARLQFPADLFAASPTKPLSDLEIPEINIPPLNGGQETAIEKQEK